MVTVYDVAKYVLQRNGGKPMSTMKLQKLAYYCQAWHAAQTGRKLFPERFEAWANGPVCPPLYQIHRGRYAITDDDLPRGAAAALTGPARVIVDAVLDEYLPMTAAALSEETHAEAPWIQARGATPAGARSNAEIGLPSMIRYYRSRSAA